jgi:AraC-like DNA-binding protein
MRISPVHLKILAYTLEVEGHGASSVLQRCGFSSLDDINEDGEWGSAERLDEMMVAALEPTGDPCFAMVAGKSLALMRYGHMVPLVLSSPNLRTVMQDLERYAGLVQDTCELLLDDVPAAPAIRIEPLVVNGRSGRFRTEFALTSALQMLRFAGAENRDVLKVSVPYPAPAEHLGRYQTNFGQSLQFDQAVCSIHFNPDLLDRPLPSRDPVAYTAARSRAEQALQAQQSRSSVVERVQQWLLTTPAGGAGLGEAAQHLGVSERTLRRQLAALGTSFVELVQNTQRLHAERLLAERRLSIKQVADQLGFSSVSTFHRAFRRWTGHTPAGWQDTRSE